jgi:hypothetical protein
MPYRLSYWMSPSAVERVGFIAALTTAIVALMFVAVIVCFA